MDPENIAQEQQDGYHTNEAGDYSMLDPNSGQYVFVAPGSVQAAIAQGFVPEKTGDWYQRQLQSRYGGRDIAAGLAGIYASIPFVGPKIVKALAPDENWEQIIAQNPNWFTGGEVAGLLMPGGVAAKGAGALAKGAGMLSAKAGAKLAAAEGAGMLARAGSTAATLGAKGAINAGAGAIEGAAFSALSEVARNQFANEPRTAEELARDVALAAKTGAGFGAGFGLLGAAITGATKPIVDGWKSKVKPITSARLKKEVLERDIQAIQGNIPKELDDRVTKLVDDIAEAKKARSAAEKRGKADLANELSAKIDELENVKKQYIEADPLLEQRAELRRLAKQANEEYLGAKVSLATSLAARSGSIALAGNLAASGIGAAAGSIMGGFGAFGGAWLGRGAIKKFIRKDLLDDLAAKISGKTHSLSEYGKKQESAILSGMRNKAAGGLQGNFGLNLKKIKMGEAAGEVFSAIDERIAGSAAEKYVPLTTKFAGQALKASTILGMSHQDTEELARSVGELTDEDTAQMFVTAKAAGLPPASVDIAAQVANAGIRRLQETSPIAGRPNNPLTGEVSKLSRVQAIEFRERMATQVDPESAVEAIVRGRYTSTQLDQLKHGHPAIYDYVAEIARSVRDEAIVTGTSLSRHQRKFITDVLGEGPSSTGATLAMLDNAKPADEDRKARLRNIQMDTASKTASAMQSLDAKY